VGGLGSGSYYGFGAKRRTEDCLSLSDYQEAAKVHADPRRREKFEAVAQWMKQLGAAEDTRLSTLL